MYSCCLSLEKPLNGSFYKPPSNENFNHLQIQYVNHLSTNIKLKIYSTGNHVDLIAIEESKQYEQSIQGYKGINNLICANGVLSVMYRSTTSHEKQRFDLQIMFKSKKRGEMHPKITEMKGRIQSIAIFLVIKIFRCLEGGQRLVLAETSKEQATPGLGSNRGQQGGCPGAQGPMWKSPRFLQQSLVWLINRTGQVVWVKVMGI